MSISISLSLSVYIYIYTYTPISISISISRPELASRVAAPVRAVAGPKAAHAGAPPGRAPSDLGGLETKFSLTNMSHLKAAQVLLFKAKGKPCCRNLERETYRSSPKGGKRLRITAPRKGDPTNKSLRSHFRATLESLESDLFSESLF